MYGVSLAEADGVYFGVPFLIAVDLTLNLIQFGTFNFDSHGRFVTQSIRRQYPAIVGSQLHIQWFELSPLPSSSNGVRIDVAP